MSDIAPLFITTDDHVMLGNKIKDCREALMFLLRSAIAGTAHHRHAKLSINALDHLRSELDCQLQTTTLPFKDPRRMTADVYGGRKRLIACPTTRQTRAQDSFAGWTRDRV